jgi:flagella basal body P-ring formation protein FlgA
LERGAAIDTRATRMAEQDVIALGCEPLDLNDTRRWRTTRRLSAGDALCAHVVESTPEVQRQRPVTLNVHRGTVSVSRVLTAASDARLGEHVRLRDRSTGATLLAIVTGPGEARVSQELR